jgi:hypothetical protein
MDKVINVKAIWDAGTESWYTSCFAVPALTVGEAKDEAELKLKLQDRMNLIDVVNGLGKHSYEFVITYEQDNFKPL